MHVTRRDVAPLAAQYGLSGANAGSVRTAHTQQQQDAQADLARSEQGLYFVMSKTFAKTVAGDPLSSRMPSSSAPERSAERGFAAVEGKMARQQQSAVMGGSFADSQQLRSRISALRREQQRQQGSLRPGIAAVSQEASVSPRLTPDDNDLAELRAEEPARFAAQSDAELRSSALDAEVGPEDASIGDLEELKRVLMASILPEVLVVDDAAEAHRICDLLTTKYQDRIFACDTEVYCFLARISTGICVQAGC